MASGSGESYFVVVVAARVSMAVLMIFVQSSTFRVDSHPMDMPSTSIRSLAKRLLSLEAEGSGEGAHGHEVVQVLEKFRVSLTRFAGAEGFSSLLRRSLALARAESPALQAVTFDPGGSLDCLERLASDAGRGGTEAVIGIVAHLLGLLVTFIGEPLTLRIVREAWPDARPGEELEA